MTRENGHRGNGRSNGKEPNCYAYLRQVIADCESREEDWMTDIAAMFETEEELAAFLSTVGQLRQTSALIIEQPTF